jgi:hypothetical protein
VTETAQVADGTPLTIEWARWGKSSRDREYRLLEYSDGQVGDRAFTEAITRYAPGNLDRLPEVTMSWFRPHGLPYYLALAIHDPWSDVLDAAHRRVRFTRFFCAPYDELAAGAFSYGAMHERFATQVLPLAPGQSTVTLHEPHTAYEPSSLALWVSGALLANRTVCVLDADGAGPDERLRFLDSVMAQLPYGVRSEMSAATWTDPTYTNHKFRLFFASARRRGEDVNVSWHEAPKDPIGYQPADRYLDFLRAQGPGIQTELAAMTTPVPFKEPDLRAMIDIALRIKVRRPRKPKPEPTPERKPGPADILRLLVQSLDSDDPPAYLLEQDLDRLQDFLDLRGQSITPKERLDCQKVISQESLLGEKPIPDAIRPRFYRLLLRVSFDDPISYAHFRIVEKCASAPFHPLLLDELYMSTSTPTDTRTRLLILNGYGNAQLILDQPLSARDLIQAAAGDLAVRHIPVLCDIAIGYLESRSPTTRELHRLLAEVGYLAPALSRAYPDDLDAQITRLTRLLALVSNNNRLDSKFVRELFGDLGQEPTLALFFAVLAMGGESSATTTYSFLTAFLQNAPMQPETRDRLFGLLPSPQAPTPQPPAPQPPAPRSAPPTGWLPFRVPPPPTSPEVPSGSSPTRVEPADGQPGSGQTTDSDPPHGGFSWSFYDKLMDIPPSYLIIIAMLMLAILLDIYVGIRE